MSEIKKFLGDKIQCGLTMIDSQANNDVDTFNENCVEFIKIKIKEIRQKLAEATQSEPKNSKDSSDLSDSDEEDLDIEAQYSNFLKNRYKKKSNLKKLKKEE